MARSVELAVTPLAQLTELPPDEPVTAPVLVEPYAAPVAVCSEAQSVEFDEVPILQPVGRVAVALVPMVKFWVTATSIVVTLNWA